MIIIWEMSIHPFVEKWLFKFFEKYFFPIKGQKPTACAWKTYEALSIMLHLFHHLFKYQLWPQPPIILFLTKWFLLWHDYSFNKYKYITLTLCQALFQELGLVSEQKWCWSWQPPVNWFVPCSLAFSFLSLFDF